MTQVTLAYERYGEADETLIILHGFMAAARNWRSAAQRLAQHFTVYVLDLRNHGASPQVEPLDYPSMCDDVLGFMDQHHLTQAHVLGHSMGGKVAMCLALQQPKRLLSLVVVDIAPVAYQHCFDNTLNALQQLPLNQIGNRKQAEQFLADAIPELAYRQFLLQNLLYQDGRYFWRIDLSIAQRYAANIVGFPEFSPRQFDGASLFLAGERSNYVDCAAVDRFFPNAKIVEIANTGHWLYVEAPEAFLQSLLAWWLKST